MRKIALLFITSIMSVYAWGGDGYVHLTIDNILNEYIYRNKELKVQILKYKNEMLAISNYRKSFLPAVSFSFSPISLNRSNRLLQNPFTGDYTNVKDYSLTSNGALMLSQKVGPTGGSISVGSSISFLREISRNANSYSTAPLYVSYSQQLLGGRRNYKYERNIYSLKAQLAQSTLRQVVAVAQQKAIRLYIAAMVCNSEVDFAKEAIKNDKELKRIAELKFQRGKIAQYELNQVITQQLTDSMSLQRATFKYHESINRLKRYLDIEEKPQCDWAINAKLPIFINVTEAMMQMEGNHPFWLNQKARREKAAYTLYQARLSNRLNANISLSYGLNKYADTFSGAYRSPDRRQSVDVTLAIPIFQWGVNRNKQRMAENDFKTEELELDQDEDDMRQNVATAVYNYNHAVGMEGLAKRSYEMAKEQYRLAKASFEMDRLAAVDLTTANKDTFMARRNYDLAMQQRIDFYFALRILTMFDYINHHEISINSQRLNEKE